MKYLSDEDLNSFRDFLLTSGLCVPALEQIALPDTGDPEFPLPSPEAVIATPSPQCPSLEKLRLWGAAIEANLEQRWGGSFSPDTYTERYRVNRRGTSCLRHYPVQRVEKVETLYAGPNHELVRQEVAGFTWEGGSLLSNLIPNCSHEVTYQAGFDPLPRGLIELLKLILIKATQEDGIGFLGAPTLDITSVSLGGLSQSGQLREQEGMDFLRQLLTQYKRTLFY